MGETYPLTAKTEPGYFNIYFLGEKSSDATALTADGFMLFLCPEGEVTKKPMIIVTYKLDRIPGVNDIYTGQLWNALYGGGGFTAIYNPDAGYEVYKLTMS
jgi:hypothetical protein